MQVPGPRDDKKVARGLNGLEQPQHLSRNKVYAREGLVNRRTWSLKWPQIDEMLLIWRRWLNRERLRGTVAQRQGYSYQRLAVMH